MAGRLGPGWARPKGLTLAAVRWNGEGGCGAVGAADRKTLAVGGRGATSCSVGAWRPGGGPLRRGRGARLYQWRNVASMHFLVPKHHLHRHQGRPREQDEVKQA